MYIFFTIASLIYGLDVLTKVLVRQKMVLGAEIPLLPFFNLVHVENTGVAFGLFPDQNWIFVMTGILLMVAIVAWSFYLHRKDRGSVFALSFVLGGALGNITDRIFFGRVTDFLDFFAGSYHWPAFNVADSAICVGAGLLLLQELLRKKMKADV